MNDNTDQTKTALPRLNETPFSDYCIELFGDKSDQSIIKLFRYIEQEFIPVNVKTSSARFNWSIKNIPIQDIKLKLKVLKTDWLKITKPERVTSRHLNGNITRTNTAKQRYFVASYKDMLKDINILKTNIPPLADMNEQDFSDCCNKKITFFMGNLYFQKIRY